MAVLSQVCYTSQAALYYSLQFRFSIFGRVGCSVSYSKGGIAQDARFCVLDGNHRPWINRLDKLGYSRTQWTSMRIQSFLAKSCAGEDRTRQWFHGLLHHPRESSIFIRGRTHEHMGGSLTKLNPTDLVSFHSGGICFPAWRVLVRTL